MLRKIVLGMMAVFLLAPFQNVTAREENDRPPRQRRIRSGGDGSMGTGFDKWFNDLNQAYEQNDRAKMGQLLKEMKNRRQRKNEGPPRKDAQRRGPDRQRPSKASAEKGQKYLKLAIEIITLVEGDAHEEIAKVKGPIDIVFLDADKAGYLDYLNKLLPLIRPGGLILAHNTTNAGPQMQDYIKAVTTDENLETIFLNKQDRGMGVTLKKR